LSVYQSWLHSLAASRRVISFPPRRHSRPSPMIAAMPIMPARWWTVIRAIPGTLPSSSVTRQQLQASRRSKLTRHAK